MRLTLTHQELSGMLRGAQEILQEKLPVALALKLRQVVRTLQPHARDAEELEREIVVRYAVKDEAGNPLPVLDADGAPQPGLVRVIDPEAAHRELRELALCPVEVEVEPIPAGELEAAGLHVSGAAILALGDLL
ncbi:MAG: hypothetical protein M3P24_02710, partial [Gemmatimonadota bacterium]|nr:hypothetical protein [Gemmatimonadota bacterium]